MYNYELRCPECGKVQEITEQMAKNSSKDGDTPSSMASRRQKSVTDRCPKCGNVSLAKRPVIADEN